MINKRLFKITSLIAVLLLIFCQVTIKAEANGNNYPIILVHGLFGWGRDEMLGFKHWGGLNDLETILNNKGYKTYTAVVGPYSSDWDRAVELYYYIKGGTVDYGAFHSKKYGHARYGKTFAGIYPQCDETNKVHLLGFSQGGNTDRLFLELLRNGDKDEQNYYAEHPDENISPLFQGNKNWVCSLTSIAATHNGTTWIEAFQSGKITFQDLMIKLGSIMGVTSSPILYDFKLDQWGIRRNPRESFISYINKIKSSKVWNSKDTSFYDLTREGSNIINNRTQTFSDVYYLSYYGYTTYSGLLGNQVIMPETNPLLLPTALTISSYKNVPFGNSDWKQSDGMVPIASSKYPSDEPYKYYDGNIEKGVWNVFPAMKGWDHFDFLGIDKIYNFNQVSTFYQNIVKNLYELPK